MTQVEIKSVDLEGKEVELVVKKPSPKNIREAELIYNKTVRKALENGSLLRGKMNDFLTEQNVWNEEKESKYQGLINSISETEHTLKIGGIALTKAKDLALELRKLRGELRDLISERQSYDTVTAEGQGDNARFNYLVSVCTFNKQGGLVWSNVDQYDDSREPYAVEAASALAKMIYGLDVDYDDKLPENQFLKKYKFVRSDLKLVNKDGHLIDEEGRLINEDGRFVAYREDGTQYFVNKTGEEVDIDGNLVLKVLPFLDDDGNPILEPQEDTNSTENV